MDNEELEEERRLAYVGITRAEEQLFLSCAQMRTLFGRTTANPPSRFLDEIPDELKEDTSIARDRYRRGTSTGGGSYGGRGLGSSGGSNFGGAASASKLFEQQSRSGSSAKAPSGPTSRVTTSTSRPTFAAPTSASKSASSESAAGFKAGDKVQHGKWGQAPSWRSKAVVMIPSYRLPFRLQLA